MLRGIELAESRANSILLIVATQVLKCPTEFGQAYEIILQL